MKKFPVIPYNRSEIGSPHPTSIPWDVADLAYSVYRQRYGDGQSLERLAERGGFGANELDDMLPDWRDRARGREPLAEGREHLTESGTFQSDKYDWCPAGFVPLKLTDPDARALLVKYAHRRQSIDAEFTRDLLDAIGEIQSSPEAAMAIRAGKAIDRYLTGIGHNSGSLRWSSDINEAKEFTESTIGVVLDLILPHDRFAYGVYLTEAESSGWNPNPKVLKGDPPPCPPNQEVHTLDVSGKGSPA